MRPKKLKPNIKLSQMDLTRSNSCRSDSAASQRSGHGGLEPDDRMLAKKNLDGEELFKLFRDKTQKQKRKDTLK